MLIDMIDISIFMTDIANDPLGSHHDCFWRKYNQFIMSSFLFLYLFLNFNIFFWLKFIIFDYGFISKKLTDLWCMQRQKTENSQNNIIFKLEKRRYLPHCYKNKNLNYNVVNRTRRADLKMYRLLSDKFPLILICLRVNDIPFKEGIQR